MGYAEDRYFEELMEEEREQEEQEIIKHIHAFIEQRNKEDGEPPDDDTILEALGLGDNGDIVEKAYELYWKK